MITWQSSKWGAGQAQDSITHKVSPCYLEYYIKMKVLHWGSFFILSKEMQLAGGNAICRGRGQCVCFQQNNLLPPLVCLHDHLCGYMLWHKCLSVFLLIRLLPTVLMRVCSASSVGASILAVPYIVLVSCVFLGRLQLEQICFLGFRAACGAPVWRCGNSGLGL